MIDIFNLIRRKWLGTGGWNPDFDSAIQLSCLLTALASLLEREGVEPSPP